MPAANEEAMIHGLLLLRSKLFSFLEFGLLELLL
jgi:hypothetical protein